MRTLTRLLIATLALGTLGAQAGALEDGIAAFEKHDFNTAVRLIEPLADQGNVEAEYFMGTFYMYGHGVPMDPPQATTWFKRAYGHWETQARAGNAQAMVEIATMLTSGLGVTRDDKAAADWLRKAGELGNAEAWAELGGLYVEGAGVPRDMAEGERLLKKAAAAGSARATEMLQKLAARTQPAQTSL
ncbi:MAG: tetratricopeptide repeat protein [Immundisolibacter sp.]|uniref:tetratricopeptide repeat protein n=1 Tax=Immundisolibacter sp. TaxID=1934948 RepID=UPI003D0AF987